MVIASYINETYEKHVNEIIASYVNETYARYVNETNASYVTKTSERYKQILCLWQADARHANEVSQARACFSVSSCMCSILARGVI